MSLKLDMNNVTAGRKETNFASELLRLMFKADTANFIRLSGAFPNAGKTVAHFKATGEILDLPYDG